MSDALRQDSELAAASWLRDPLEAEHQDELVAWHGRFAETAHQRQPLSALFDQLLGLYPKDLLTPPQLLEFPDLLWLKGSGGLFDGHSGRVVQASCVSRFLRQRQLPFLRRHRIELSQPLSSFPRLEQVVWLPTAGSSLFGELFTEVLGFLWPFLLEPTEALLGWPVLLPGCDPQDVYSAVLHQLLREHHTFPLLEQHLPEALHLERVLIPEPGFLLHALAHRCFCRLLRSWLIACLRELSLNRSNACTWPAATTTPWRLSWKKTAGRCWSCWLSRCRCRWRPSELRH